MKSHSAGRTPCQPSNTLRISPSGAGGAQVPQARVETYRTQWPSQSATRSRADGHMWGSEPLIECSPPPLRQARRGTDHAASPVHFGLIHSLKSRSRVNRRPKWAFLLKRPTCDLLPAAMASPLPTHLSPKYQGQLSLMGVTQLPIVSFCILYKII